MTSAANWPHVATPTPRPTTPWPSARKPPRVGHRRMRRRPDSHPRAGTWSGGAFHRKGLERVEERLSHPGLADDLRPRSAAGAARVFLRPQACGQGRRDPGVVGRRGGARSRRPPRRGERSHPSRAGYPARPTGTPSGWSVLCWEAWRGPTTSASRWRVKPSDGVSERPKIKAFLGDGLPWNWSIHRPLFRDFTPILDFIHVLSYLYLAAKALHEKADDIWEQYIVWMRGAWQGEVAQVLEELRAWQTKSATLRQTPRTTIRGRSSPRRSRT